MIGWMIEEESQEYTNLGTGDRWLLSAQVIESRDGDGESYIVVVLARYLMDIEAMEINTPMPWPGGHLREELQVPKTIPDTQLYIRLETAVDDTEAIRGAKTELLRRVMGMIHKMDVIGQFPPAVQAYIQ